jgi:hypothetical protein
MLRQAAAVLMEAMATWLVTTGVTYAASAPAIPTVFNPTIVEAMQAIAGHTQVPRWR